MRVLISLAIVVAGLPSSFGAEKSETPHLAFVTEFVRELAVTENLRASAERELMQAKESNERFSAAIHISTLIQLELQSQIEMLKGMKLNEPFEKLIPTITVFYGEKIALHQKVIEISTALLTGPKPGVDYGKLAVEMPKIRAKLDYIDKALLEASPMVFATLIDPKPDSKNHVSHLIVTKAERATLIEDVTGAFGDKLNQKGQNYTVSAASVLKTYFQKDFKCSDEPWQ
jgi:hypothetical protein